MTEDLGEFNGFEVYPMPMFVTLAVGDPNELAEWYVSALGFGVMFQGPVVHLRRHKYQDILLVPGSGLPGGPTISFSVDGEVDALAARARAVAPIGKVAIDGPIDTPWNTRDLRVTDPAGHRLVFTGRRLERDAETEARVRAMLEAGRRHPNQ